jgi:putative DNA methylase
MVTHMRPHRFLVQLALAGHAFLPRLQILSRQPVPCAPQADVEMPCRLTLASAIAHLTNARTPDSAATVVNCSATSPTIEEKLDLVVTDPPYYDAIPYSDLMDFFYVWLRRTLHGLSPEIDQTFNEPLGPKWNTEKKDGELIDDSSRFDVERAASKNAYEDGMFRAFQACDRALVPDGRMVVVFANKSPNAWETLVSAIVRAGFSSMEAGQFKPKWELAIGL